MTKAIEKTGEPRAAPRRFGYAVALISAAVFSAAAPAAANSICAPHDQMVEMLNERFSEQPTAIGIAGNGQLLEVFTAGDGSTWTIVMTTPKGVSCVVSDGLNWDARQRVAMGPLT